MIATASARKTCRVFSAYVEETGEEYDLSRHSHSSPLIPLHSLIAAMTLPCVALPLQA